MNVSMNQVTAITPYSPPKYAFLTSLAQDLTSFGGSVRLRRHGPNIHFVARISSYAERTAVAKLKAIRRRRLQTEANFIRKMEKKYISALFGDGKEIDAHNIKPTIHVCHTRKQNEVFHYCRLIQSFPTANLIGRQLRLLVFDEGQKRPILMGAIGLSSSPYSLSCRDKFLHWKANPERLQRGLDSVMQLSVCMSLPPYSYLLGGKLMAALALSKTVADEYQARYKNRLRPGTKLLGLITICAAGKHCPIFNRIMLRPGGLYRRIGETAGYTTAHFSRETMERARRLVQLSKRRRDNAVFGKSMRTVKSALRICDLSYEGIVRNGLRKGVYIGSGSAEAIASLQSGSINRRVPSLDVPRIIEYWQTHLISTRLCRKDVERQTRRFRGQTLLLSRNIRS